MDPTVNSSCSCGLDDEALKYAANHTVRATSIGVKTFTD